MAEHEHGLKRVRENEEDDVPGDSKKVCKEDVPAAESTDIENPNIQLNGGTAHGQCTKQVKLGPRFFQSSIAMMDYFYELLHGWPINLNLNKYEHLILEDLIKLGHVEAEKKIGAGIKAFQLKVHPKYENRCFYVIRQDGSMEDFSYRKCVDNILPLPSDLKSKVSPDKCPVKKGKHNHKGRGRGMHQK